MVLAIEAVPDLVVVLRHGQSCFVPCLEANHPEKGKILSVSRNSSRLGTCPGGANDGDDEG